MQIKGANDNIVINDKLESYKGMICMKRVLIGGFISLIGSIWALAIVFIAGNNLVSSWPTRLGRFWGTVVEMGLLPIFVLSVIFVIAGVVIMAVELFRKEQ